MTELMQDVLLTGFRARRQPQAPVSGLKPWPRWSELEPGHLAAILCAVVSTVVAARRAGDFLTSIGVLKWLS